MSQIDLFEIVNKTMSFRIQIDLFELIYETTNKSDKF